MLAFNAETYLEEAIDSVLSQDFTDFELIVIDDGSTDQTVKVVESYTDNRIKLHQNGTNRGIVYSRNKGIELSSGTYIGMLDADDIALPGKFRKQVEFLQKNSSFGMVGSWATLIDEQGNKLGRKWKLPGTPDKIPPIMLFKNYFVQSAVIFRRDCLPSYHYKEGYEIVEDYKLWIDILKRAKGWNLPEYLVKYRMHSKNITKTKEQVVRDNLVAVYREILSELDIDPSTEELELHHLIREGETVHDRKTFRDATRWLMKLEKQNAAKRIFRRREFAAVLLNRWTRLVWMSRDINILFFLRFFNVKILSEFLASRIYRNYA